MLLHSLISVFSCYHCCVHSDDSGDSRMHCVAMHCISYDRDHKTFVLVLLLVFLVGKNMLLLIFVNTNSLSEEGIGHDIKHSA